MKNDRSRREREEIRELLTQFENLKAGRTNSFIDQEGFERIIEHFDERDKFADGLLACAYGLSQYPGSVSIMLSKANLLILSKKYKEALTVLDEAEGIDNTDADLYILRTDAYLALDMQAKAAEVLETALENFDGDEKIDLLFELCDVYDDYENFDKVFDCLRQILKRDPVNQEALYKICFWTDFTGRNEESIQIHKEIIEETPFNELAWFNLGAAYQGLKLHEKALDAYQYAIAIDEKFDNAYRNMGDAYLRLRKYRDAIECLEKTIELSMPEAVIYEAIGHCYDRLANYAQARFHYKKARHMNADDSRMHYKIACTYMNEDSWAGAIRSLHAALKIHPNQADYHLALGQSHARLGQIDEALECFSQVLKLKPKSIGGWTEMLHTLYEAEFYKDGVEYAGYAYERTDAKPIFLFFKSLFLFAAKQPKEAAVVLEEAMSKNPKLVKKFIDMDPAILSNRVVVDIIARHKKKS